jgi:hypothetical protein
LIWLESHQLPKTENNEPQNASLESLFEEMFSKEFCELLPNWSKSLLWALCLKPRWTHWWPVPGTGGHIGLSSRKSVQLWWCETMMMWKWLVVNQEYARQTSKWKGAKASCPWE